VSPVVTPLTRRRLDEAQEALAARDIRLGEVIARVGPCTMLPRREGTHFGHLVRNIIHQQLSTGAAATIHGRFVALIGGERDAPDPAAILALPEEALRACGLSMAKTRAIRDLALHVVDGRLPMHALDTMTDDEVIQALVPVRGIGPWTAQMFLMFRLGRPDVLPVLDLGVRKGAQRMYRTRALPDAARLEKLARNWRPWASVASWYCWRALELDDATSTSPRALRAARRVP
jgi:DNA-3-methyladenine glycosylase II